MKGLAMYIVNKDTETRRLKMMPVDILKEIDKGDIDPVTFGTFFEKEELLGVVIETKLVVSEGLIVENKSFKVSDGVSEYSFDITVEPDVEIETETETETETEVAEYPKIIDDDGYVPFGRNVKPIPRNEKVLKRFNATCRILGVSNTDDNMLKPDVRADKNKEHGEVFTPEAIVSSVSNIISTDEMPVLIDVCAGLGQFSIDYMIKAAESFKNKDSVAAFIFGKLVFSEIQVESAGMILNIFGVRSNIYIGDSIKFMETFDLSGDTEDSIESKNKLTRLSRGSEVVKEENRGVFLLHGDEWVKLDVSGYRWTYLHPEEAAAAMVSIVDGIC